jgi:hypothetical protein
MRAFIGFAFYLLLPLVMLAFFWKAAVFPHWGTALLVVAVAVIAMHLMLPLHKLLWRKKAVLSLSAAILAGGLILTFGPLYRPFNLFRANLSDQWLAGVDLKGVDLEYANLTGANLERAILTGANLSSAKLIGAKLIFAKLSGADLNGAKLSGADLI